MSKTEANLKKAFTGESEARNRYTFFAQVAREEGYHYIAKIFEELADNEKFHAMEEYRRLHPNSTTAENLRLAVANEDKESSEMYPAFARDAEVEGNRDAEILFTQIARIEKEHKERLKNLLALVESDGVFKRDTPIKWKCGICGYTVSGHAPPNKCPYCKVAKERYEPANLDV